MECEHGYYMITIWDEVLKKNGLGNFNWFYLNSLWDMYVKPLGYKGADGDRHTSEFNISNSVAISISSRATNTC